MFEALCTLFSCTKTELTIYLISLLVVIIISCAVMATWD